MIRTRPSHGARRKSSHSGYLSSDGSSGQRGGRQRCTHLMRARYSELDRASLAAIVSRRCCGEAARKMVSKMRRISSRVTFLFKQVFPLIWLGFFAIFFAVSLSGFWRSGDFTALPFLIIPVLITIFGFLIMKKLVFDLADEVIDVGDALLIRNGSKQEQVPL